MLVSLERVGYMEIIWLIQQIYSYFLPKMKKVEYKGKPYCII